MTTPGFYSAHWREGGTECGASASEYGVNFWWSTGPRPDDGWGESYTWERWFAEGKTKGGGGPSDMLTRIEAVGRFLGHAPKPQPTSQRADLDVDPEKLAAASRAYLRDLQIEAAHTTPETLRLSRREFGRMRTQVLQRAQILWEQLCPGIAVSPNPPLQLGEGTRSKRITVFRRAGSAAGYALVEIEDRVEVSTGVSTWYSLRVQCTLDAQHQFGIWFIEGECQWELIVADEQAVDRLGSELARTHPDWFKDQTVCGAIHAFVDYPNGNSTMFNRCVGRTGPTRLAEQQSGQLWPIELPQPDRGHDPSMFRPWSAKVTRILGFAFEANAELRRRAIESGLHWIEPIGTAQDNCWLGLRRLPRLPPERWPVLLCHGPNAATVATELRNSLAILVWWLGPRDDLGRTEILQRHWPGIEDQLEACADGVGGSAAIDRLRQWLEAERDPDLDQPRNNPLYYAAMARTLSQLDPGQASFRRQVVALAQNPEHPLQLEDVALAWRESLSATYYSIKAWDPDLAWAVSALPSLDLAGRFGLVHVPTVTVDASLPALAARVALRQARTGPVARALLALTEAQAAGIAYDGVAHIEAAASASVAGDHESAWQLLAAAGYWSCRANGKADPVIFEAACAVAKQAGYGELMPADDASSGSL